MLSPAPNGGLWNGRKVAEWMSQMTGKKVTRMRGWEYLKQMEYSLRVPRPEHQEISLEEQQEWKKNSFRDTIAPSYHWWPTTRAI